MKYTFYRLSLVVIGYLTGTVFGGRYCACFALQPNVLYIPSEYHSQYLCLNQSVYIHKNNLPHAMWLETKLEGVSKRKCSGAIYVQRRITNQSIIHGLHVQSRFWSEHTNTISSVFQFGISPFENSCDTVYSKFSVSHEGYYTYTPLTVIYSGYALEFYKDMPLQFSVTGGGIFTAFPRDLRMAITLLKATGTYTLNFFALLKMYDEIEYNFEFICAQIGVIPSYTNLKKMHIADLVSNIIVTAGIQRMVRRSIAISGTAQCLVEKKITRTYSTVMMLSAGMIRFFR